jgi:CRISPR-associated endonuclease/helicase Cas3
MSLLKFSDFDIKLNIDSKYKAHLSNDKQKKESLKEHIDLVFDYFLKLIEQNGLEVHLNSLFEKSAYLFEAIESKEEFVNFVKYLFAKAIYWHDMGKMNPIFQKERMLNDIDEKAKGLDSHHSLLGAYLYINHSLDELYANKLPDEEEILEAIIYLFGFLISKHHGVIYQYKDLNFKNEFAAFLDIFHIKTEHTKKLRDENRTFSSIFDHIENNEEVLFLLSKSFFSLLIISDYYATAQFMNYGNIDGLAYNDFGLIDDEFRDKVYEEFYRDKFDKNGRQISFNQALKDIKNIDINFDKLEERSNGNLNILRNKLFLEVRENLRKNIDKRLFYIEAPTGAGKTNLSIMSAVEILQHNKSINKVFYVFPFTTLITQTYDSIKGLLNLDDSQIVQLHSKAKYNQKGKNGKSEAELDGVYGDDKKIFLDNQFMNYPITLLSHVKFFNVLTGVSKDDNYIFHRLANSIVIIDEIQTYNPDLWSNIVYLLDSFAHKFNIKFIVMSATLPKIGDILNKPNSSFTSLVSNKQKYFSNPNFGERVIIESKPIKIKKPNEIWKKLLAESENYQKLQSNRTNVVRTIIEFITKKGADEFYKEAIKDGNKFFDEIFLLSGTILEPRRREIIDFLKNTHDKNILLVTTQVVEAGVDIDMDIGFKEKSLIDSDEQLAGRINRNSSKKGNKLFLFEMENPKAKFVYRNDKRLEVCIDEDVLKTKNFDVYYEQVIKNLKELNDTPFLEGLDSYIGHIKNLRFNEIHIKIIDMESLSVFVPLNDEAERIWEEYCEAIKSQDLDFIERKIKLEKLASSISKYTFSLADYENSGLQYLKKYGDEKYGYLYLKDWNTVADKKKLYDYKNGLETSVLSGKFVPMIM